MSIRVSTRGVRASAGPRIARVSVGSGGTRVSSGLGPFFASTSVGGGRRRSSASRRSSPRSTGPSLAQLERARRAAERAQQQVERDARIAELRRLREQTTSVHLQDFPVACPPQIPAPPDLGEAWARSEAEGFHLRGIGRFARSDRAAARQRAAADGSAYLAAERARLTRVHEDLADQADVWWHRLLGNDEATVCDTVNEAFADNLAAGCAVGLEHGVLSVVMRQQDIDTLPNQAPGLTSAGRPTLKTLTKRDRQLWWLTILGSNLVATVKEAMATAPGVDAVDLAVLTRLPNTQRLDVVAFGRWTRRAIESARWREPADALRFLDIGDDVQCALSPTDLRIRAVDTTAVPGLRALVDSAVEDGFDDSAEDPAAVEDPYRIVPFAQWTADRDDPSDPTPPSPPVAAQPLVAGQNLVLPEDAESDLTIDFSFAGADADLTLLLLGGDQKVRSDDDFAFYNHPVAAHGAARLLGTTRRGDRSSERASLRPSALPADVHRVAIAINMDVDVGLTCAELHDAGLTITCPTGAWTIPTPPDPSIRAMVLAEVYRHTVDGRPAWKLRAVGQGWADGLAALARTHGVNIT